MLRSFLRILFGKGPVNGETNPPQYPKYIGPYFIEKLSAEELNGMGHASQEDYEAYYANMVSEEHLLRCAFGAFEALDNSAFRKAVSDSRTEHPRWWSDSQWLEFVKREFAFRIAITELAAAESRLAERASG